MIQKMIDEQVNNIVARIEQAKAEAGRSDEVLLLAVSKKVTLERMNEALKAGVRAFGESYVQEALSKIESLGESVRFDLVGPLQSNKVKHVVGRFYLIHSVDRISIAHEISKVAGKKAVVQPILLQVNISNEPTKSGCEIDDLSELCRTVLDLPNLAIKGLMMIGSPPEAGKDIQRQEFRRLRDLKGELEVKFGIDLPQLSMGMSDDFELAIAEGATIVRIGSGLFGER